MNGLLDVVLIVAAIVCPLVSVVSPICAATILLKVHRRELDHRHRCNALEVEAEAERRRSCHAANEQHRNAVADLVQNLCDTAKLALPLLLSKEAIEAMFGAGKPSTPPSGEPST